MIKGGLDIRTLVFDREKTLDSVMAVNFRKMALVPNRDEFEEAYGILKESESYYEDKPLIHKLPRSITNLWSFAYRIQLVFNGGLSRTFDMSPEDFISYVNDNFKFNFQKYEAFLLENDKASHSFTTFGDLIYSATEKMFDSGTGVYNQHYWPERRVTFAPGSLYLAFLRSDGAGFATDKEIRSGRYHKHINYATFPNVLKEDFGREVHTAIWHIIRDVLVWHYLHLFDESSGGSPSQGVGYSGNFRVFWEFFETLRNPWESQDSSVNEYLGLFEDE